MTAIRFKPDICLKIAATLAGALVLASAAQAQSVEFGVEATNDEVRRGLSWSDGEISASSEVAVGLAGLEVSARVAMLRRSDRHANAEAVADLALGKDWDAGAFTIRTEGIAHVFAGADAGMDYGELGLGARYTIGPLQLGTNAFYAPSQDAIGGDNLYIRATALAGIPAFPVSVMASVGHTTGDTKNARSARLRPLGDYTDWKLGVEYNQWPITVGVDYIGTDVDTSGITVSPFADLRHAGDKVVGRIRLSF